PTRRASTPAARWSTTMASEASPQRSSSGPTATSWSGRTASSPRSSCGRSWTGCSARRRRWPAARRGLGLHHRQLLDQRLELAPGDDVVEAGGDLAVGADQEDPRLVDVLVRRPGDPLLGGVVELLGLVVLPDLDVDEPGPVGVILGQALDH